MISEPLKWKRLGWVGDYRYVASVPEPTKNGEYHEIRVFHRNGKVRWEIYRTRAEGRTTHSELIADGNGGLDIASGKKAAHAALQQING